MANPASPSPIPGHHAFNPPNIAAIPPTPIPGATIATPSVAGAPVIATPNPVPAAQPGAAGIANVGPAAIKAANAPGTPPAVTTHKTTAATIKGWVEEAQDVQKQNLYRASRNIDLPAPPGSSKWTQFKQTVKMIFAGLKTSKLFNAIMGIVGVLAVAAALTLCVILPPVGAAAVSGAFILGKLVIASIVMGIGVGLAMSGAEGWHQINRNHELMHDYGVDIYADHRRCETAQANLENIAKFLDLMDKHPRRNPDDGTSFEQFVVEASGGEKLEFEPGHLSAYSRAFENEVAFKEKLEEKRKLQFKKKIAEELEQIGADKIRLTNNTDIDKKIKQLEDKVKSNEDEITTIKSDMLAQVGTLTDVQKLGMISRTKTLEQDTPIIKEFIGELNQLKKINQEISDLQDKEDPKAEDLTKIAELGDQRDTLIGSLKKPDIDTTQIPEIDKDLKKLADKKPRLLAEIEAIKADAARYKKPATPPPATATPTPSAPPEEEVEITPHGAAAPATPAAPAVPTPPPGRPASSAAPAAPPARPAPLTPVQRIAQESIPQLRGNALGDKVVCFYKTGPTEFLGNFADCPNGVTVFGEKFPCAEAAFQYRKFQLAAQNLPNGHPQKNQLLNDINKFKYDSGEDAFMIRQRYDQQYAGIYAPNWLTGGRDQAMWEVLQAKFNQNPTLKQQLDQTKGAYLLEHNQVKGRDTYWSDDFDGKGNNMLGKMLMAIRDSKSKPPVGDTDNALALEGLAAYANGRGNLKYDIYH